MLLLCFQLSAEMWGAGPLLLDMVLGGSTSAVPHSMQGVLSCQPLSCLATVAQVHLAARCRMSPCWLSGEDPAGQRGGRTTSVHIHCLGISCLVLHVTSHCSSQSWTLLVKLQLDSPQKDTL